MGQDSQVKHFDHVGGSHAPLDAESQVLTGELIDNVADLEHAPRHVYSPTVDAWRQNRSSTGAQAHNHAAFSPRPPRGLGNTLTGTAQQRSTQDAEKTPDQPGSSQPRAGAPGLEVSLHELTQRCLLQLHDNLLRRVLRELPHGHTFCQATSSQDYSGQPYHNKRSEIPRPRQCRRRVGPSCSAIPSPGAGGVATRGGVVPKVQTVSEKDADNGLLWAKWSAISAKGSETVTCPAGRSRLLEGSSAS